MGAIGGAAASRYARNTCVRRDSLLFPRFPTALQYQPSVPTFSANTLDPQTVDHHPDTERIEYIANRVLRMFLESDARDGSIGGERIGLGSMDITNGSTTRFDLEMAERCCSFKRLGNHF